MLIFKTVPIVVQLLKTHRGKLAITPRYLAFGWDSAHSSILAVLSDSHSFQEGGRRERGSGDSRSKQISQVLRELRTTKFRKPLQDREAVKGSWEFLGTEGIGTGRNLSY